MARKVQGSANIVVSSDSENLEEALVRSRAKKISDKTNGKQEPQILIQPLRLGTLNLILTGTAPYVQARFSQKAMLCIQEKHKAGSQAKKGTKRTARVFEEEYEQAKHKFSDGSCGIPAPAFRSAMITACKLCGFHMTIAKLSVFILADGVDVVDGTPLVRINGKPEMSILPVRNATGVTDLRARPMWRKWSSNWRVQFDRDQFSPSDVYNLAIRAGIQVGFGEGRPDSKKSNGMGWGTFSVDLPPGTNLEIVDLGANAQEI